MTLSVDQLRLRLNTPLGDEALQDKLDAAYELIDQRLGPIGEAAELLDARGPLLMLSRRAISITSIKEGLRTLDTGDYQLRTGGRTLLRLQTGANPSRRWRGRVDVTYLPFLNEASRDEAAASLVELDLNFTPGLVSERIGDWAQEFVQDQSLDINAQRELILAGLDADFILL